MAYRIRNNYVPDLPPPGPVPRQPTITSVTAGDTTATVAWTYPSNDVDVDHWDIGVYQGAAFLGLVRVEGPTTRSHVLGELTNGVAYSVEVQGVNLNGRGPMSNRVEFTPQALKIPAPTILSVTPRDGSIGYTFREGDNVPGKVTGHRYVAKRVDSGYEFEGEAIEDAAGTGHTGPLDNDRTYRVYLATVVDGKVGPYSEPSAEVTPTQPIPPYKPRLTGAQIAPGNNGQIDVSFVPGVQNITATRPRRGWRRLRKGRTGPGDITAWQIRVTAVKDGTEKVYDVRDGSIRSYRTEKVALGSYTVDVRALNAVGWSDWSNQLQVTYTPVDNRPFSSDKPFGTYESATYYYAIFDPGNDPGKGWDVMWTCTFTEAGKALTYDVLMVGAGGGGKGQTATFGKGGNGGGGQLTILKAKSPLDTNTFTVFISIGGSTAIDPKATNVKWAGTDYPSQAGKSASSGTDATGYDRVSVGEWTDCRSAFTWLEPDSTYVGGVAQDGKQGFPNGLGWGCAGAGTKNGNPGRGVEGLVVIRWPK